MANFNQKPFAFGQFRTPTVNVGNASQLAASQLFSTLMSMKNAKQNRAFQEKMTDESRRERRSLLTEERAHRQRLTVAAAQKKMQLDAVGRQAMGDVSNMIAGAISGDGQVVKHAKVPIADAIGTTGPEAEAFYLGGRGGGAGGEETDQQKVIKKLLSSGLEYSWADPEELEFIQFDIMDKVVEKYGPEVGNHIDEAVTKEFEQRFSSYKAQGAAEKDALTDFNARMAGQAPVTSKTMTGTPSEFGVNIEGFASGGTKQSFVPSQVDQMAGIEERLAEPMPVSGDQAAALYKLLGSPEIGLAGPGVFQDPENGFSVESTVDEDGRRSPVVTTTNPNMQLLADKLTAEANRNEETKRIVTGFHGNNGAGDAAYLTKIAEPLFRRIGSKVPTRPQTDEELTLKQQPQPSPLDQNLMQILKER